MEPKRFIKSVFISSHSQTLMNEFMHILPGTILMFVIALTMTSCAEKSGHIKTQEWVGHHRDELTTLRGRRWLNQVSTELGEGQPRLSATRWAGQSQTQSMSHRLHHGLQGHNSGSRRLLLFTDDEVIHPCTLSLHLEGAGHEVKEYPTVRIGLPLYRRRPPGPAGPPSTVIKCLLLPWVKLGCRVFWNSRPTVWIVDPEFMTVICRRGISIPPRTW